MSIVIRLILCLLVIVSLSACHVVSENASLNKHPLQIKKTIPTRHNSITAINPEQYKKAYVQFLQRAKTGDPIAAFNLGRMYADGRGVDVNDHLAFEWFQKSASQGHPDATLSLGVAYLFAKGTKKNSKQACRLFRQAVEQGEDAGQEFYGQYCV